MSSAQEPDWGDRLPAPVATSSRARETWAASAEGLDLEEEPVRGLRLDYSDAVKRAVAVCLRQLGKLEKLQDERMLTPQEVRSVADLANALYALGRGKPGKGNSTKVIPRPSPVEAASGRDERPK